jgi:hypothetical protein
MDLNPWRKGGSASGSSQFNGANAGSQGPFGEYAEQTWTYSEKNGFKGKKPGDGYQFHQDHKDWWEKNKT